LPTKTDEIRIAPLCSLAASRARAYAGPVPDALRPIDGPRLAIHGPSGSGKTTLARSIAEQLDAPLLELDELYHQANWTALELEEFRARVSEFVGRRAWICDGNYRAVRDLVWSRAQLIVVIDLPRSTVASRILRRTIRRSLLRTELWNGNRERLRTLFLRDPERNIVLWSWRTHGRYHGEFHDEVRRDAPHATFVVLRGPAEVTAFERAGVRAWLDMVENRES
jgi:adenylate kinase family enzyme